MERLILCGWESDETRLLEALRIEAQLEAVAVGDHRAAALVQARTALRLPCYQHLREMVRTTAFDAMLIAAPELAADLATDAAARGCDLLLLGDQMDGAALEAAATASIRYGVALAVLRPALRSAGLLFLADFIEADARWTPVALQIDMRDDRPIHAQLRDAVATVTRLMRSTPTEVIASVAGPDLDEPIVAAAHIRFEDGRLASVSAQPAESARLRISAHTAAGTIELDSADGDSRLTLAPRGHEPQRSLLRDEDATTLESRRVAAVRRRDDALDARLAHREASLLHALEASMASGLPARVEDLGTRSTLRMLTGGSTAPTPRVGQLHVVSV